MSVTDRAVQQAWLKALEQAIREEVCKHIKEHLMCSYQRGVAKGYTNNV